MKRNIPISIVFLLALLLLVFLFLLRAFSFPATTDSGTFSAIALHMLHGKRLYADVWDNKPPGVFLFYKYALQCFGKSWQGVHVFLSIINLGMYACLFFAVRKLLNSAFFAFLICAGFTLVYFDISLYSTGGLTEEFGTISLIVGASLIVLGKQNYWMVLSGIAMVSLAPWFKEPFVFISLPTLVYVFMQYRKELGAAKLLLAMILPHLLMLVWLLNYGLLEIYSQTIVRNISYTKEDGGIFFSLKKNAHLIKSYYWNTNYIYCVCVVLSLLFLLKQYRHKRQWQNVIFFLLLGIASTYVVFMSAKGFGHYFQMGTFFLLVSATYTFWYLNLKSKIPIYSLSKWAVTILLFFMVLSYLSDAGFKWRYANQNENRITLYVKERKKKGDQIFVESQNLGALYLETGLSSPVPMPVAFNVHVQTNWGLKIMKHQDSIIRATHPRFVIQNKQWIASTGLFNTRHVFRENYLVKDSLQSRHTEDFYYLLERR